MDSPPQDQLLREWTAEELLCLQSAARVARVPLSSLLRFAKAESQAQTKKSPVEAIREDSGSSPATQDQAITSSPLPDNARINLEASHPRGLNLDPWDAHSMQNVIISEPIPDFVDAGAASSSPQDPSPNASSQLYLLAADSTGEWFPPFDGQEPPPADVFAMLEPRLDTEQDFEGLWDLSLPLPDDLGAVDLDAAFPSAGRVFDLETAIVYPVDPIDRSGSHNGVGLVSTTDENQDRSLLPAHVTRPSSHVPTPTTREHDTRVSKARRRPPDVTRAKKRTTQLRSCVTCSVSHKSCHPVPGSSVCLRCRGLKYSMSNLPCIYLQISDVILFRSTTSPLSCIPYTALSIGNPIISPVKPHDGHESKTIEVTQGYGSPLKLKVKRFDHLEVDASVPEGAKPLYSHPWALADISESTLAINDFMIRNVTAYVEAKVEPDDAITWIVFQEAHSVVRTGGINAEFIYDVLRLWTTCRAIEGGWCFCGSEFLGIPPRGDGTRSLTSAQFIDYQFSAVVVGNILLPLRQKVLKRLYNLTHSHTARNWLSVFLANFVLLHSYQLLMKQQRAFAARRKSNSRYLLIELVRGIHAGAKTLLAHFHHICKGQTPFEVDWKAESRARAVIRMAEVSEPQAKFLASLVDKTKSTVPLFINLANTDQYESNHWFTGQLFVPNWKPSDTI